MSWQTYIDNMLATKSVALAAIHGLDGNPWATSAGFSCSPKEVLTLVSAYKNQDILTQQGIVISGRKYMFLRMDENAIYGKSKSDGCCVIKCVQCIILATYTEGMQPGQCNEVVGKTADFLKSSGY